MVSGSARLLENGASGPAGDDNVACMVGEEQGYQSRRGFIN
jgi:hypothetical protein